MRCRPPTATPSPRSKPAPEVYLASAWGDSEGPHPGMVFPLSPSLPFLVNSSPMWRRVAFGPPYLWRGEAVLEGRLQVLRVGEGVAWINPCCASPSPWLPSPAPPAHRPPRVRGSLLCASRILPGRCQSPECGQRPCWWIPQMERGNRPNRPQPQAIS